MLVGVRREERDLLVMLFKAILILGGVWCLVFVFGSGVLEKGGEGVNE